MIRGAGMLSIAATAYLAWATSDVRAQPVLGDARGWTFRCPVAGTVVQRSDGDGRLAFHGSDSADPLICLTQGGERRLLGLWRLTQPSAQAALGPLRGLFPAQPGRQIQFFYTRTESRTHLSGSYTDTWRVLGTEPLDIPAGRFNAVALERQTGGGTVGRFHRRLRFWLDAATGAPLKVVHDAQGGTTDPGVRSWEAISLRLPGGAGLRR